MEAFDVSGRHAAMISTGEYSGQGDIVWRPENLAGGVYFIQVKTENSSETKSIIFIR